MYHQFLNAISLNKAFDTFAEQFTIINGEQLCDIEHSTGQILAVNYPATTDLPGFDRSTVDGYAVVSKTTFGATDENPIYLPLAGLIKMGTNPDFKLKPGMVAEISTGGALPEGADAVVMIEHTSILKDNTVEIRRAVSPLENVVGKADDIAAGETLLTEGSILTSLNTGLLAAMGIDKVRVKCPLSATIIATGDEIVSHRQKAVPPGCVRNVNNPLLSAMLHQLNITVTDKGIIKDKESLLREAVTQGLKASDIILISGGSSAGAKDYTLKVINDFTQGEILFHGLRIAPGKPTILGKIGKKPVIGLPGHPVSMAVVMRFFVIPLIKRLQGRKKWKPEPLMKVRINEQISSKPGREEFVRVFKDSATCNSTGDYPVATIIRGPSGAISSLSRANGYVRIPADTEGFSEGAILDFFSIEE